MVEMQYARNKKRKNMRLAKRAEKKFVRAFFAGPMGLPMYDLVAYLVDSERTMGTYELVLDTHGRSSYDERDNNGRLNDP